MTEQFHNTRSETNISPLWGAFPVEQFLIRHWDFSSTLPAADQRHGLVQAYLQLDSIPKDWDATGRVYLTTTISRVPEEREIREILGPWQPPRLCKVALHSDEKFRLSREINEDYDPALEEDYRTWIVLDDQAWFEGDWTVAHNVFLELASPTSNHDPFTHRHFGHPEELEPLRQKLREVVASAVCLKGKGNTVEQLKTHDIEAGNAGMEIQAKVVASFLFVADAEAFETEKLRLIYLYARDTAQVYRGVGDARPLEREENSETARFGTIAMGMNGVYQLVTEAF
ncbi:hypothetical protein F4774DRAFT_427247 [Daldinia eschscholtzii]|nr:hypothetical protein F4774DRAFT_427247 [Daldinia eschscholtzii]